MKFAVRSFEDSSGMGRILGTAWFMGVALWGKSNQLVCGLASHIFKNCALFDDSCFISPVSTEIRSEVP
jgi:hypothetical protein